jgi:hypothetical protein
MRLFLDCDDWTGLAVFRPVGRRLWAKLSGRSTIDQGGGKRRGCIGYANAAFEPLWYAWLLRVMPSAARVP